MKGLIITGGAFPPFEKIKTHLEQSDLVIAADSGLDKCIELEIKPHIVLGDMDSLSSRSILDKFPDAEIEEFPAEKDYTDTELAITRAFEKKCDTIVLAGGGEGRLDHTLGLFRLFEHSVRPDIWLTAREEIFLIENKVTLEGEAGDMISFFPIGGEVCRMITSGLVWPLDHFSWTYKDVGISNRFSENSVSVEMKSGKLLCILPFFAE